MKSNSERLYQNIILNLKKYRENLDKNLLNTAKKVTKLSPEKLHSLCSLEKGKLAGFNLAIDVIQRELNFIGNRPIDPKYRAEIAGRYIKNFKVHLSDNDKGTKRK